MAVVGASMTTAYNAWSIRRRRSNTLGKNEPERSLGIFNSTVPPLVINSRDRTPLRSVRRSGERSYRSAPITAIASASINSCNTIRTDSRTTSTSSPF